MTEYLFDNSNERPYNVKSDTLGNMGIMPYFEKEGEEYMNEHQLAHIEKILLAWRQSLMEPAKKKSSASNYVPVIANVN